MVSKEQNNSSQLRDQFHFIVRRTIYSLRRAIALDEGASSMRRIVMFLKDESGATAIEYGLIAAGISVVIIAAVNAIGSSLNAKFDYIATSLK